MATEDAQEQRRGPLRHLPGLVAGLVVTAFIALLLYGIVARNPDTTIDDSLARDQATLAPSYHLAVLQRGTLGARLRSRIGPVLTDHRVSNDELRGTPYVLNFWASWCVPCREEAPRLQRAWQRARPRGVLFVGLDMQDTREDARVFMRQFGIDYLNIRDPTNEIARKYGVTGIPETFFVSARGDVVNHVIGVVTAAQLRQGIAAAVAGRPRAARNGGARRSTR